MSETTNGPSPELTAVEQFEQFPSELQKAFIARSADSEIFLENSVGRDKLSSVDLWENIRKQVSDIAYKNTHLLLREHVPLEDDPVIESIYKSISLDLFGNPSFGIHTGRDIVDWHAGVELLEECREVEDLSEKEVAEVMEATHLLSQYGLYKYAKWHNGSQLLLATEIAKEAAKKGEVTDFGDLEQVEHMLLLLSAACTLDYNSKPHYQYAKPERVNIMQNSYAALVNLSSVRMHGEFK